jgi:hypothetical protein
VKNLKRGPMPLALSRKNGFTRSSGAIAVMSRSAANAALENALPMMIVAPTAMRPRKHIPDISPPKAIVHPLSPMGEIHRPQNAINLRDQLYDAP